MKYYAVIDTNVLVSSLLSPHPDSATVLIRNHIANGDLVPLFNAEILAEYRSVLARPKLGFPENLAAAVLDVINAVGFPLARTASTESFPGHGKYQALPQETFCCHAGEDARHN